MEQSEKVKSIYSKAGWYEGRSQDVKYLSWLSSSAYDYAIEILRQYAGLHLIPSEREGIHLSTADIYFYENPILDMDNQFSSWSLKIGPLVEFANAQAENILLLAGIEKTIYLYTIPDGKLYFGGSLNGAIETLLLGIEYGEPIE